MKTIITVILSLCCASMCFAQTKSARDYLDEANELLDKEEYKEALETLDLAISEMPDSVALYDMRGAIFEAFKLFDKAIKDFTIAVEKTSDVELKAHFLSNRGGSKYKIRDFTGAYDDLIKALDVDPSNIDALNNLAVVCDEMDKPDEALKYLNQIIQVDSNYVPAYVNLGFKYQGMDEHQKAIEYFDKALSLAPEEALAYSNRSFSKLKINDLKGAMKDINRSIKLFPSNSYAYKIRALILIEKNKVKDACADLTKASDLGYSAQYGSEVNYLKGRYCK